MKARRFSYHYHKAATAPASHARIRKKCGNFRGYHTNFLKYFTLLGAIFCDFPCTPAKFLYPSYMNKNTRDFLLDTGVDILFFGGMFLAFAALMAALAAPYLLSWHLGILH